MTRPSALPLTTLHANVQTVSYWMSMCPFIHACSYCLLATVESVCGKGCLKEHLHLVVGRFPSSNPPTYTLRTSIAARHRIPFIAPGPM